MKNRRIHELLSPAKELAVKFLREHPGGHTEHEAVLLAEAVLRSKVGQAVTDQGCWGRCNAGTSDRLVFFGPFDPDGPTGEAIDLRTPRPPVVVE